MPITHQSRQTLAISIICVLVVVAAAIFAYGFSGSKESTNDLAVNVASSATPVKNSTSTDWQKSFFEVSSSSKSYNVSTASTLNASGSSTGPITNTDALGRNFLVAYSKIHQAGLQTDADTINTVAEQLASNSLSTMPAPKNYYSSDIVTVKDSYTTIGNYALSLTSILNNSMPAQNEAVIASNALDKGDMTMLQQIDPVIATYKKTINSLLATPVPQSAIQYHMDLVNGFSMELSNATALRNIDNDPLQSLNAIGQEVPALQRINTALANLQKYFNTSNVTFTAPTQSK